MSYFLKDFETKTRTFQVQIIQEKYFLLSRPFQKKFNIIYPAKGPRCLKDCDEQSLRHAYRMIMDALNK